MVRIVFPSARSAGYMQERIGSPSTSTVQAPHSDFFACDLRAGQPQPVPQQIRQRFTRDGRQRILFAVYSKGELIFHLSPLSQ